MFNALVELAGQSSAMSNHVLKGFKAFAALLRRWLEEAEQQGLLRDGLNLDEIANFLVISLNGAAPLYAASQIRPFGSKPWHNCTFISRA